MEICEKIHVIELDEIKNGIDGKKRASSLGASKSNPINL